MSEQLTKSHEKQFSKAFDRMNGAAKRFARAFRQAHEVSTTTSDDRATKVTKSLGTALKAFLDQFGAAASAAREVKGQDARAFRNSAEMSAKPEKRKVGRPRATVTAAPVAAAPARKAEKATRKPKEVAEVVTAKPRAVAAAPASTKPKAAAPAKKAAVKTPPPPPAKKAPVIDIDFTFDE